MEELNDDELQELLSNGVNASYITSNKQDNSDLRAYQELFNTLAKEPSQGLPFSFAATVRRKMQEQLNRKSDRRFNLLAITIFILTLVLAYGLLVLISPATSQLVLNMALKFKWILAMAIAAFFCFLLTNQQDVKREY